MLNKIILIGRLGTDPEVRFTAAGNSMTTFRLAVTTRERGADGEMVDHTEWFTVIIALRGLAWGYVGEGPAGLANVLADALPHLFPATDDARRFVLSLPQDEPWRVP